MDNEKLNEREKAIVGKYSLIGDDIEIGENSKIWSFCNIFGGCKIGKNTLIGSYCELKREVIIGDNCRLHAYVVAEYAKIGNNVFVGPHVTFLDDKHPSTKKAIEKSYKLDGIIIEDDVSIGGGVVILPGVKIKKGAIIGAGSIVTKDVPEYAVVCGNPARIIGDARNEKYK